ncbi:MAG: NADH-quinone oxidoreductase subunit B family protein [Dehalogenimonas sp.]
MTRLLNNIFSTKPAVRIVPTDESFERVGTTLRSEISRVFGRSLAIREVDSGSDNAAEIEINNLTMPHYDIERFGVTFTASPRHADIILITGAVTVAMAEAVRKTYDAMPQPGWVIAVGDDACGTGILNDSYAVIGGADKVLLVDFRIPGNPPTPQEIMTGLLSFMRTVGTDRLP